MPTNTTVADGNIQDYSALGNLPKWDLSDLYKAEDDPELNKDLDWLRKACSNFAEDYQGKLDKLGAMGLLDAVERYQAIEVVAGKLMSFAGLRYYQLTTDAQRTKFMSDMQDKVTKLTTPLVFYGLEFNRISGDRITSLLNEDSGLARYKPVFDRMRAMKPYQLSDELEKFLHDQSVVGASAWNRLFDETVASLTFQIKGQELPLEAATNKLSDKNRDMREVAAREIARVLKKNTSLFARVHNTLVKEKEVEDQWRKMPTPQTGRHLSNHVETEVVQALRDAVVSAYPKLSHRYYSLKAKWMGLEKMQIWDRNAPLPIEAVSYTHLTLPTSDLV